MAESSLLRRDAQKAYEKKEYRMALAILEKALASEPSRDDLLASLDLRVSISLKLDDKVSARKDATHMIRTNRADGRGYLRLGQLERLTDDSAATIKWYEYGLKNVPEGDRLRAYITAQHAKTMAMLKAQTVLSKPVDPFTKLPAEIIQMIVAFLNYREATVFLRVSKTWHSVLSTYSVLRNTLDFSDVAKGRLVSFAAMRAALRRSQKAERPVVVVAAHLTRSAARHLKQTLDRWIHYTKMQHFEVHHPSDDRMQSSVDFQFLQWHRFNLKTVVFGVDHPVRMDIFYKIMQSCEGLQKATFMALSSLPEDAPADAWVQSTVASRPNLLSLTMQGPSPTGPSKIPPIFFDRFSELRHLTLRSIAFDLDPGPPTLLDFSSLTSLDFSRLKSLESFEGCKLDLRRWAVFPASLEVLNCTEICVDWPSWARPQNTNPLEKLRIARLPKCESVLQILYSITSPGSARLTYLDLDLSGVGYIDLNGVGFTNPAWSLFLEIIGSSRLAELTFLRLCYPTLCDRQVELAFFRFCPKLETLDLSSYTITGVSIVSLLTAPQNRIKRLVLRDCTNVSPDTFEWARQRGVQVERVATDAWGGPGTRFRQLY